MILHVLHKKKYGADYFLAIDDKTREFLNIFPVKGTGERKGLMLHQVNRLKKLGMKIKIEEIYELPAI